MLPAQTLVVERKCVGSRGSAAPLSESPIGLRRGCGMEQRGVAGCRGSGGAACRGIVRIASWAQSRWTGSTARPGVGRVPPRARAAQATAGHKAQRTLRFRSRSARAVSGGRGTRGGLGAAVRRWPVSASGTLYIRAVVLGPGPQLGSGTERAWMGEPAAPSLCTAGSLSHALIAKSDMPPSVLVACGLRREEGRSSPAVRHGAGP